jgi:predicted GH43/DUF377 family glycosyl hydrolase
MCRSFQLLFTLIIAATTLAQTTAPSTQPTNPVSDADMARVYETVKTPFKYGVIIRGQDKQAVDCPSVFHFRDHWYMIFIAFDGKGYETRLARSDDLLKWETLGTILPRGSGGWDTEQAAGGVALLDYHWNGTWELQSYDDKYWLSYLGGKLTGYETPPLSIGVAWTKDPTSPTPWTRPAENPALRPDEPAARAFEKKTLFKSNIIRDPDQTLGFPFVMFFNACQAGRSIERIGMAVSKDMIHWQRFGDEPGIDNSEGGKKPGISGDPQIVRMGDLWVMFYFGAFWRPGAFDTFACSHDLIHWTKWTGPDLIARSESWDKTFAHKPWVVQKDGVVYHFYCAVSGNDRTIAVATSRDLGKAN